MTSPLMANLGTEGYQPGVSRGLEGTQNTPREPLEEGQEEAQGGHRGGGHQRVRHGDRVVDEYVQPCVLGRLIVAVEQRPGTRAQLAAQPDVCRREAGKARQAEQHRVPIDDGHQPRHMI